MSSQSVLQLYVEWSALVLTCVLIVVALPIVVLAFYALRLSVRRKSLVNKLLELNLESEYVRLYDSERWRSLRNKQDGKGARRSFDAVLSSQFRGDNRGLSYVPPAALLLITALAFVGIILRVSTKPNTDLMNYPVLFAIAGAFVYVYPRMIARYASLTLNPHCVYEFLGSLWISVLTGIVFTVVADEKLKVVAAFLGSLLPIPTLIFLKEKLFTKQSDTEKAEEEECRSLMEILGHDQDLCEQLSYIGVRSVRALADENPIRLFAEVDPDLVLCVDLVDRANLFQWIPDPTTRAAVHALGYRAAVDLMSVVFEELPPRDDPAGRRHYRFLGLDEPLPAHLQKPLAALATALRFPDVETLRNLLAMMAEDPQLAYLQNLWVRMSDSVEEAFDVQTLVATAEMEATSSGRRQAADRETTLSSGESSSLVTLPSDVRIFPKARPRT